MKADVLLFFSSHPEMIPLYERLEEEILRICPETVIDVQKSQIAFSCRFRFAFASMRGERFVVTFGLAERIEHPRIKQASEPYPNRWTHHVIVASAQEIDAELMGWIEQACRFASCK
ncbi:MAG: hypothetical protein IJ507_03365 [Clostridia bacterium]|nr:hypothetical protein [Clostridia bacterium]